MVEVCQQCKERPATETLPWYIGAPLLLIGIGGLDERLCADCAGGKSLVGFATLAAVFIAAFIIAVVVW
jgi:hypothetical protein